MGNLCVPSYSVEPVDKMEFTNTNDHTYTQIATPYDWFVQLNPFWKGWLNSTLPHIQGPRILEVSFGTGYLLTQIVDKKSNDYPEVHGVEWNHKLLQVAQTNLAKQQEPSQDTPNNCQVKLVHGRVEDLPYPNDYFDSVVVTMAFSGYPDGRQALRELKRVVKRDGGRLILVDVGYPKDENRWGVVWANLWKAAGDLIRDMGALFQEFDLDYTDTEVGGSGSIHLYVATKR